MAKTLLLKTPFASTPIAFGPLAQTPLFLKLTKGRKVAIIADSALKQAAKALQNLTLGELFFFPAKEANKTRRWKEKLENRLLKHRLGSDCLIIALGGGTTTDLVGFLASTYLRGVSLLLIPTTLLGMVDAAIGGKTAVNTPYGKNLIGSFYAPTAIFIDPSFLQTLPLKEIRNGFAEIVKYGLIQKKGLFKKCEAWAKTKDSLKPLSSLITASIQAKINIVEIDPFEKKGLRKILNFGHTIGHGLEVLSNYQLMHGEAVALGCLVESHLSKELGYLSPQEFTRIERLFRIFDFPLCLPASYSRSSLLNTLIHDKKNKEGKIHFVLLEKIGSPVCFNGTFSTAVPKAALNRSLDWMESSFLLKR